MKVYEYVLIKHPTKKEKDEGKFMEIAGPVSAVVAYDEVQARNIAMNDYLQDIDTLPTDADIRRLEVLVRPFV